MLELLTESMTVVLQDSGMTLSRSTIGRVLNRNCLCPHASEYWRIPHGEDAEFVVHMEDILDVYQMPYDPKHPLYCMDESLFPCIPEISRRLIRSTSTMEW